MRSGLLLLLVVLALAALAALLWWRFKGSGQSAAAPAAVLAPRNHHSLRSFHYEPAAAVQKAAAAIAVEAGAALAQLLPEEDLVKAASGSAEAAAEQLAIGSATGENPEPAESELTESEAPRPASIRHAAGAVASLLDTLDNSAAAKSEPSAEASESASETDEEPAPALYFNPLTAPAPTANDQANRAAEIALRQQRRARMSTNAAAQRTALSGLFPGAGSPVPAAQPS